MAEREVAILRYYNYNKLLTSCCHVAYISVPIRQLCIRRDEPAGGGAGAELQCMHRSLSRLYVSLSRLRERECQSTYHACQPRSRPDMQMRLRLVLGLLTALVLHVWQPSFMTTFIFLTPTTLNFCFVVGRIPLGIDSELRDMITAQGVEVTLTLDRDLTLTKCETQCDVVVYSASGYGFYGYSIRNCSTPVLTWEEGFYRATGMSGPNIGSDAGLSDDTAIMLQDPGATLAAGLHDQQASGGKVDMSREPYPMSFVDADALLAAGARVVATQVASPQKAVLFYMCKGSRLVAPLFPGEKSPALRIGLPLYHHEIDGPPFPSTETWRRLFDNALQLLASGDPLGCRSD